MSQSILQGQTKLPASIQLFRYAPDRRRFQWDAWAPSQVRTPDDLPPYLILGELDVDSLNISASGWSAIWQGAEPSTQFQVTYLADKSRYELRQTWRGVDGGFSTYPSRIPLNKLIPQTLYMQFPSSWDREAKEALEQKFQLTYVEQPKEAVSFCGIPDGAFITIAFPLAIRNLRPVRQWLREVTSNPGLSYPISAEAKLLFQAINYLEGKAPEWTRSEAVVFNHSLDETGIAPYSFPVKETANDGSSAWTLRRDVYVLFIGLPFAGVTDFLDRMTTTNGPIRSRIAPALRIELQPVVLPAAFELQTQSITFWDKGRTTRCYWQFSKPGETPTSPTVEAIMHGDAVAEDLLSSAENISSGVTEAIQEIMKRTLAPKGR